VRFQDDTKETRELFMGQFSEATRARYPTPERLILAAVFDEVLRDPPVAQQILASHGYAGSGGVQIMTTWTRLASGVERRDDNPFEERADGWGFPTFSLTGKNVYLGDLRARFDPQSGEVLPAKRPAKN